MKDTMKNNMKDTMKNPIKDTLEDTIKNDTKNSQATLQVGDAPETVDPELQEIFSDLAARDCEKIVNIAAGQPHIPEAEWQKFLSDFVAPLEENKENTSIVKALISFVFGEEGK